jgi:protein-arginine kinase activator protein McsA
MRCERCGKELTNRIIKINGITYCENCARTMGYDRFLRDPSDIMGNPFAPLDEIASTLMQMSELDFGNSTLTCPKCGMTLREFENEGRVGCIECYNTFNDNIVREMFKQQGNSEYAGRLPGRTAATDAETQAVLQTPKPSKKAVEAKTQEAGSETSGKEKEKTESSPEAKADKSGLTVDKLMKADLGMLSDEDLEKGIKIAAEAEEYRLASKLRDELKGRKEGENNG